MGRKNDERSDLQRVFAQLHVLADLLLAGERSPLALRPLLQQMIDGELPGPGPFDLHLYGLDDQLLKLRHFNETLWGGRLTKAQLDAVDVTTDRAQSLTNLELLYVDFGSPMDTLKMWWKVISAYHNAAQVPIFGSLVVNEAAVMYQPGIHRVRINLLAYKNFTVDSARGRSRLDGFKLAQAEILAAMAYFPGLPKMCDGKNLPRWWISGWDAWPPLTRGGMARVPAFHHDLVSERIVLTSSAGERTQYKGHACPVIIG